MKLKIQRGYENKFYLGLLALVAVAFTFFLSSKLWMYDDNRIVQTPYHTNINGLDQTTLVLNKWEYNPEKSLMEVLLQTKHTGTDPVKPTFTFVAKEGGEMTTYPVEVIYQDAASIVLHIKDVPEKFKAVGVFVRELRDKMVLENEAKESYVGEQGSLNQDGDVVKYEVPKPKEKVVIGDYRTVKINKKLGEKTKIAYQDEFIQREIKQTEKKITSIKEGSIPHQEDLKRLYEQEIITLEEDMKYQTTIEKKDTTSAIRSKNGLIEKASERQEEYRHEIKMLSEKRSKLLERLQGLQGEKSSDKARIDEEVGTNDAEKQGNGLE